MSANRVVERKIANPFGIPADESMLDRIISDSQENGGSLVANDHWTLGRDQVQSLTDMLDPLIGCVGMQPVDANAIACYEAFLRGIDHLKLCKGDLLAQGRSRGWVKSDLGTLMDLNLITAYLPDPLPAKLSIVEVGGGYGRLAEAMLRLAPGAVHHLLIDAVPGSLMYAYLYLRRLFPRRRIGSFYAGDAYDPDFDCYIMPAWHSPNLADGAFDLAVNIESMQEMDGHHIDYYLALFDRVTVPDGTIYISNARDYVYQGPWNFPERWEVLFMHNTPRSWSRVHPTIVMRKGAADYGRERMVQESAFAAEAAHWNPGLASLRP
jgi:putative sugar O-methyltransferase